MRDEATAVHSASPIMTRPVFGGAISEVTWPMRPTADLSRSAEERSTEPENSFVRTRRSTARYRIVNVRKPEHECYLTEGKVRIVEVERMCRTVCVEKKYAIDGSLITFFPSECGQVGCPHYHKCNPDGIDRETKVKILSVNGKAECPIGQNRMVIELE